MKITTARALLGFNLTFSNLNLQDTFVASIESAGYLSPTDLQSQLIPLISDRKSVVVWSQSAAGKTGAFLIPAVNYILANPLDEKRGARILILTSRRDRVSQINYTLKRLTRDHNMRFGFIVSGRPYQPQMRLMRRPLDMMVATPGRLNDLVDNNKADFSQLEMLIIDDMTTIFQKNMHDLIGKILGQVSKECPTVAFVRQDDAVANLVKKLFPDALEIESLEEENEELEISSDDNKNSTNVAAKPQKSKKPAPSFPKHEQHAYVADDYTHKIALMDHFLDEFAGEPTVIYASTTKTAKSLQENLSNHGHGVDLASELNANEISATDTPTLIVSDQKMQKLPNGSDTHILHFDLPYKLDNYRNRLNAHDTDRESAMLILADGNDYDALRRIEKEIGSPIAQKTAPGLEPLNPFISTQATKPKRQSNRKPNAKTNKPNTAKKPNKQSKGRGTAKPSAKKTTTSGKPKITHARKKASGSRTSTSDDKETRRQRKGPYGRLNGGAQRKRNDFGVSTVGTKNNQPAQMSNSEWDKAIAENKPSKEPRVVIRYKDKKRTLLKDDPKPDADT